MNNYTITLSKSLWILIFLLFIRTNNANATISILKATGGTSISADKAANATTPAYTVLGIIRFTEVGISDFSAGTNVLLTINTPAGWSFNPSAGITSTFIAGRDMTSATVLSKTATTITIQFTVGGITSLDALTISGIQIRCNDGANVSGITNLYSGGTATIVGCPSNTNLGNLSETNGVINRLVTTLPGMTYVDGTTLAGSGAIGTPINQSSGTSFAISHITAADQFYNIVTSYSGLKTITFSGPSNGLTAPSYINAVTFVSGRSTTTLNTTLKKAEITHITATDGIIGGVASANFSVDASALNKFVVEASGGGSIGAQIAGTPFNIRVSAKDAENNICSGGLNDFTETADITSNGSLLAGGGTTGSFTGGVLTLSGVSFSNTGSFTISATRTSGGIQNGTSNSFTVSPGSVNNFVVESTGGGSISSQISGTPFNIKITAFDAQNNICNSGPNNFNGTVNITSSGILNTGSGTTPAFVGGVLATRSVSISNTGSFSITATRTSGGPESGTSNSFTVRPGALNNFLVEAATGGSIGSQFAGIPFNIKISARDANNNICNSGPNTFNGTADITSTGNLTSGGGTTSSFSNGVLNSLSVTIIFGGNFVINSTNTIGAETGSSNLFFVNNLLPQLNDISPDCIVTGGSSFILTVDGINFNSGSIVRINGSNRATAFINSTQLEATIISSDISTDGIFDIDVINPLPVGGVTSTLPITASTPTTIDIQPVSNIACNGSSANFSVSASGMNVSFQWTKNGIPLTDGGSISGASSSDLSINPVDISDTSSSYSVVISSTCYTDLNSDLISLIVLENTSSTNDVSICQGQSYTPPGGIPESASGTYTTHISNVFGCDSTITTNLTVLQNSSSTASVSICSGQSYTPPGGSAETTSGTYVTQITNAEGCDSTITTNLFVNTSISSSANITICPGDSVVLPDLTVVYPLITDDYITSIPSIEVPGCDSIITTHVDVNAKPDLSVIVTQIPCFGDLGSVVLDATNGTPPYNFGGSQTLLLTAGQYFYSVTDDFGCTDTASIIINPEPSQVALSALTSQIPCFNGTGSVTLIPSGGSSPYTFSGDDTTNLTAGVYNYTVTDANGCMANAVSLVNPEPDPLILNATANQIACRGGKGSVTLSSTGGTPLYTYSGSPVINLNSGNYYYTVTDSKGCTATSSATIAPAPATLSGSVTSTKTNCGINTGTVTVAGTGGTAPYSYNWNTAPAQTTAQATGLGVGTYQVTITDDHGCTTVLQKAVTQQLPTAISITGKSVVCPGTATSVCATAGLATYVWNTGDTTKCYNAITPGTYYVTCTNLYGCTSTASKILTAGTTPSATITGNNYICPGTPTSLCAPSGFTSYRWSNNVLTSCLNATTGGIYTVTVTNASGCTATSSITVNSPMTTSITRANGTCANGFFGNATVNVTGQTGPYLYLWTNDSTTQTIDGLTAGTYSVTVTDVYGCTKSASTTVAVTKAASDYSTINSFFLDRDIQAGNYIWFNNSVKVNYTGTYPVTIWFTNQNITSSRFNLVPANGKLILTNAVSQAITTFNGTEWETTAPPNATGQYFISGFSYQVPVMIPKNLSPVSWKGIWNASCPGLNTVDWKWSAAVYSNFSTDLTTLGVKSMDGSTTTQYTNTDFAGSPENFLPYCVIGARGGGGTSYTGMYTGIAHRSLCAPLVCNSGNTPPSKISKNNWVKTETDIIYNAYPNPFTSVVTIEFERLAEAANTTIDVYNFKGQKIATLFNNSIEEGVKYSTEFNAEDLVGGIYFFKIISGDDVVNGKLILNKP